MDLPEEKVELLNSKIKHIADDYNARLLNLNNRNRQLLEDFTKLKIMTGDEFSDLDIKNQVSKTLILTTNAALIWNEFNAQQPGFFVECIKNDYGIGNNFAAKVVADFNDQISEIQRHNEILNTEIAKNFREKIEAQAKIIKEIQNEKQDLIF